MPHPPSAPPATDPVRRRLLCTAWATLLGACSRHEPRTGGQPVAGAEPAVADAATAQRAVDAPDLLASAILLPGQVNSASEGTLIELVQALDDVYEAGRISIEAAPLARATLAVARGAADMGFPALRMGPVADAALPYRLSTASVGQVSFVVYSHVRARLTREMILRAAARGEAFPYAIEAPAKAWGFPTRRFTTFESALHKVSAGRIDALLWAQEDADLPLRQLRLRNIHRAHFGDYDTVFLLPRTPRGDFVDGVLTAAVEKLRKGGRLQAIYSKIYKAYDDWQPSAVARDVPVPRSSMVVQRPIARHAA